jgi:hypothetical protein
MFSIILAILLVDTIFLCIFAIKCNPSMIEYLVPMYLLLVIGYGMLYSISRKMQGGKREKLQDKLIRLREENEQLKKKTDSGKIDSATPKE